MSTGPVQASDENTELWRKVLVQGHLPQNFIRRVMRRLPSEPRCKVCNNPFGGFGGKLCAWVGMRPSRKNPNICAICCEDMPRGGAEIHTVILFADVRGSTQIAEEMGPTLFSDALNRFYSAATHVLLRHNATIDKLIGDEVMAFFVPGHAGPDFEHVAVEAARHLLLRTGHGGSGRPELPIGVGVDSGVAFVGNVGSEKYVDFTVLGDPVNTAAHIQAAAQAGEILVGDGLFRSIGAHYPGSKARRLKVRGKRTQIGVHSIPLKPQPA